MYSEPTPEQRSTTLKSYNEDERMLRSYEVLYILALTALHCGTSNAPTSCRDRRCDHAEELLRPKK